MPRIKPSSKKHLKKEKKRQEKRDRSAPKEEQVPVRRKPAIARQENASG